MNHPTSQVSKGQKMPHSPYKPYQHTDGRWYVGRGGRFFLDLSFVTQAEAQVGCLKQFGRDCQDHIDLISLWLETNDPQYRSDDPSGWLA